MREKAILVIFNDSRSEPEVKDLINNLDNENISAININELDWDRLKYKNKGDEENAHKFIYGKRKNYIGCVFVPEGYKPSAGGAGYEFIKRKIDDLKEGRFDRKDKISKRVSGWLILEGKAGCSKEFAPDCAKPLPIDASNFIKRLRGYIDGCIRNKIEDSRRIVDDKANSVSQRYRCVDLVLQDLCERIDDEDKCEKLVNLYDELYGFMCKRSELFSGVDWCSNENKYYDNASKEILKMLAELDHSPAFMHGGDGSDGGAEKYEKYRVYLFALRVRIGILLAEAHAALIAAQRLQSNSAEKAREDEYKQYLRNWRILCGRENGERPDKGSLDKLDFIVKDGYKELFSRHRDYLGRFMALQSFVNVSANDPILRDGDRARLILDCYNERAGIPDPELFKPAKPSDEQEGAMLGDESRRLLIETAKAQIESFKSLYKAMEGLDKAQQPYFASFLGVFEERINEFLREAGLEKEPELTEGAREFFDRAEQRSALMDAQDAAPTNEELALCGLLGVEARNSGHYDVFISHKSEDLEHAEELYYRLRRRRRPLSVFLDRNELDGLGKADYAESIFDSLDKARILVIVFSEIDHLKSSWVKDEYTTFISEINEGRKQGEVLLYCPDELCKKLSKNKKDLPLRLRRYSIFGFGKAAELVRFIWNAATPTHAETGMIESTQE